MRRERDVPIDALARADEAFLSSTTREVQPIAHVDGGALPAAPGPVATALAPRSASSSPATSIPDVRASRRGDGFKPVGAEGVRRRAAEIVTSRPSSRRTTRCPSAVRSTASASNVSPGSSTRTRRPSVADARSRLRRRSRRARRGARRAARAAAASSSSRDDRLRRAKVAGGRGRGELGRERVPRNVAGPCRPRPRAPVFSARIPASLRSSTTTSFGHLSTAPMPATSRTASIAASAGRNRHQRKPLRREPRPQQDRHEERRAGRGGPRAPEPAPACGLLVGDRHQAFGRAPLAPRPGGTRFVESTRSNHCTGPKRVLVMRARRAAQPSTACRSMARL